MPATIISAALWVSAHVLTNGYFSMKIGIDCQSLAGAASGLGQYTRKLIEWLPQVDSQNHYYFFHCWKNFRGKTYDRLLWENGALPFKAFGHKLDVLHVPAFAVPLIKAARRIVVTVHDLIGVIFPEHLSLPSRFYWSKWLPFVNRNADLIMADSECTKSDIVRYMKFAPGKIRVIPLAADEKFSVQKHASELDNVCIKYSIQRPFVLFLGNVEPRKNLPRLIQAFHRVKFQGEIKHQLVIAGSRSWPYPELVQLCRQSGVMESIKFIDYVEANDIVSLYQASDLFVFPSLYEGFGLPILEAMACGIPVITSNVSSMPEVGGNAVYYVNPCKEEEIAKAIHEVLTDRGAWHELQRKGRERVRQFSWKRTAQETQQVFEGL